ncbi:MAG TPA: oligosaccharide flippase family protein [Candidatus Angelobacter sp.]|nr:oligosaccharide flippase family protein [Candidatus Angelobacter sp.]
MSAADAVSVVNRGRRQIPSLDGLRGIAVLTVMFHHLVPDLQVFGKTTAIIADFGWVGVDLFFVLSGFLITGILLDSRKEKNYFRSFYWRRILRVWPLYYGMVAAIYLVGPHLKLAAGWNILHYSPLIYLFFAQNIFLTDWGIYPLTPTWSLAIEEQFYLFWPFAIRFFSLRAIRNTLLAIVFLSPFARLLGVHFGNSWHQVYTFSWFRLDGLAMGALIAILFRSPNFNEDVWRKRAKIGAVVFGVAMIVTLFMHALPKSGTESAWIYSWVAWASGGIAILCAGSRRTPFLEGASLRFIGQISYGLYLLHTPVFAVVNVVSRSLHVPPGKLFYFCLVAIKIALAIAAAAISWYGMEKRILRFKNYFQPGARKAGTPAVANLAAPDKGSALAHVKERARHSMAALTIRYGLGIAINIIGTFVLSRLVGPEVWGAFAIAQVVYMSSQEILGRGVATYLIKKSGAPTTVDVGNTFALQHLIGFIFFASAALIAVPAAHWYAHLELVPLLIAAAIASYFYAWRSVPLALLERDLSYVKVAIIEILDLTVFNMTAILFACFGHLVAGLAAAIAARAIFSTGIAYFFAPVRPKLFFSPSSVRGIVDFGGTMTGNSLLNIAILFIPALLVGKLAGITQLAPLQMSFSLFGNLLFASAAILRLSLSAYARIAEHPGELQRNVNNNMETAAAAFVPTVVLFAGLSPLWVPLALGAKWNALPFLLLLLAPAYFLSSIFWGILNSAFVVSGRHRTIFAFLVCFLTIYAPVTWVLTLKFGAVGAAAAFSITHILLYPALLIAYWRAVGRLRLRKLGLQLFTGIVCTGLLWMGSQYAPWIAAGGAIVYLTIWYLRNSEALNSLLRLIRVFKGRPVVAAEEA